MHLIFKGKKFGKLNNWGQTVYIIKMFCTLLQLALTYIFTIYDHLIDYQCNLF